MVSTQRYWGTVADFNIISGTGTIVMPDGREAKVRYSSVRGQGIRHLERGTGVSFLLEETRRGLYAVCVQPE
jgi:cold shock CspA family protein